MNLFPVASSMTTPVFMSKTKTGAVFLVELPIVVDAAGGSNNRFGWFRTLLTGFLGLFLRSVIIIGL